MPGKDLGSILSSVAEGTAYAPTGNSMPSGTITTSLAKEKKKVRMVFNTKTFYISDDISAKEFSNFINWIMEEGKKRKLLREESTFTPTGELVRICDYLRRADDTGEEEISQLEVVEDEREETLDITREPVPTQEKGEKGKGERFSDDDYVSE